MPDLEEERERPETKATLRQWPISQLSFSMSFEKQEIRRAAVPHKCHRCGKTIRPGVRYRLFTVMKDGKFTEIKECWL